MKSVDNNTPSFEPLEPRLLLSESHGLGEVVAAAKSLIYDTRDGGSLRDAVLNLAGPAAQRGEAAIRAALPDMAHDYGNTFADAAPISFREPGEMTVRGAIGYAGDADMMVLVAPKTGVMTVDLSTKGWRYALAGDLSAYGAGRDLLAHDTGSGADGATVSFAVVKGQRYYVQVASADGGQGRWVAEFNVRNPPANRPPVARDDAYGVDEDGVLAASTGVLANDSDPDGNALAAMLVGGAAHGAITFNADGTFTYKPNARWHGADSFTYKANDGKADSNVATVTLTVNPVNHPPVAVDDLYGMDEGGTLAASVGVLANDSDVDGDALTAALVGGPAGGALTLNPDGTFTYKPNAHFSGTDSFTYKANDGQADSNLATVTIVVNPVNEPPVAQDDGFIMDQDGTLLSVVSVLANDTDADGDNLTATLTSGPQNGSLQFSPDGTFTYTPSAGWFGTETFSYKAGDGQAESNVATVMITVTPSNYPPVANDDVYTVKAGGYMDLSGAQGVLANDTDAEGDWLGATLVGNGAVHGTLYFGSMGDFYYSPNAGFTGVDTFTYVADDGYHFSNTATVTINVIA